MKVAFYTLGCKVNYYEAEVLKSLFHSRGFEVVGDEEQADAYILNSCTVTAAGDKKTRQVLHRFKRQNPQAVIALTGCMPQAFPEESEQLAEAQVVTGAQNRSLLPDYVLRAMQTGERIVDISPHKQGETFEPMKAEDFSERTRAFVKIEDGCDRYCSYCIIPKARGPIRSKSLLDLEEELTALASRGYQEIVLVGINLSSYGKECGLRLIDAVELACSIEGIARVRLGSLEPELLSEDDIERMRRQPKFCPQFHLSLQSGCDETLKRMNRHYDTAFYRDLVGKLRRIFPDCSITTDIMVGFSGEMEAEFEASLAFAQEIGFAKAHVFSYSIRQGTQAASFPNQLDKKTKDARSKRMIAATEQTRQQFALEQVGNVVDVLFETVQQGNQNVGYTPNYLPVTVPSERVLTNEIHAVKLVETNADGCVGILL